MATISCRPVTSLAMRSAASFDSPPVETSSTRSSLPGETLAISAARSTTGRRQDRRIEMVELADVVARDGDDLGMAVAQDRAHLAGGEIEDAPAVGVGEPVALRRSRRSPARTRRRSARDGRGPWPRTRDRCSCSCRLQRRAHQRQAIVAEEHRARRRTSSGCRSRRARSARRCWRAAAPCTRRSRWRRRSAGARARPWRRCRPARPPCEMSRSSLQ